METPGDTGGDKSGPKRTQVANMVSGVPKIRLRGIPCSNPTQPWMSSRPNPLARIPDYRVPPCGTFTAEALVERWYEQLLWIHNNVSGLLIRGRNSLRVQLLGHAVPHNVERKDQCSEKVSQRIDFFTSNGTEACERPIPRTPCEKPKNKLRSRSGSPMARAPERDLDRPTRPCEGHAVDGPSFMSEYGDREDVTTSIQPGTGVLQEEARITPVRSRQNSPSTSRSISPALSAESGGIVEGTREQVVASEYEYEGNTSLNQEERIYCLGAEASKLPDLGLKDGPGPHFSVFAKPKPVALVNEPVDIMVEAETSKRSGPLVQKEGQLTHSFVSDISRLCALIVALLPGPLQIYDRVYLTRSAWELRKSQFQYCKPRGLHCIHVFDVISLDDILLLHNSELGLSRPR